MVYTRESLVVVAARLLGLTSASVRMTLTDPAALTQMIKHDLSPQIFIQKWEESIAGKGMDMKPSRFTEEQIGFGRAVSG
jgi:hypothetical protein